MTTWKNILRLDWKVWLERLRWVYCYAWKTEKEKLKVNFDCNATFGNYSILNINM